MEYGNLVAKYNDRGETTHIAVGLRPSGKIHLGNMATVALAGILGRDIGPHLSKVNITVCDLDMPDASDWCYKQHGYVRYFRDIPDPSGQHDSLLGAATESIDALVTAMQDALDVPFFTQLLSSVQQTEAYRDGLKRVVETEGIMDYLLSGRVPEGNVLAFPLCPECGFTNPKRAEYHDGIIVTDCSNPDCSVEEYETDIMDCDRDIAVHFFIDPIRDCVVMPRMDVHIFGGDYRDEHDGTHVPKIEKIQRLWQIAGGEYVPDVLTGPTFYARDGSKMSKSKNNGLLQATLHNHFSQTGADSVSRLIDFVDFLMTEGYKVVDYRVTSEYLLEN